VRALEIVGAPQLILQDLLVNKYLK